MKIIALTGGIASGKSTVAKMFSALKAAVVQADLLAHQVYRPGSQVHRAIVRRYGTGILDSRRRIDRKKLGHILFSSKKEKAWLESKIHPEVFRLAGAEIRKAMRRRPPLILVEAALHIEAGYWKSFEGLIVVDVKPAQQMERLVKRDGLTPKEARLRLKNQLKRRARLRHADWVIDNSGTLTATRKQVKNLFRKIVK